jgi:hypothetical protein
MIETWPAGSGGLSALMVVALTTVTATAPAAPNRTAAIDAKFEPVIVIHVPPTAGPVDGVKLLIAGGGGGATYVNAPADVPDFPSGFVTAIVTGPATCAGLVAEMLVALFTVVDVAPTFPNFTVAAVWKFVPVIATTVPPLVEPVAGVKLATVGEGVSYVNCVVDVAL